MSSYWYEVRRRNIPITGSLLKAQAHKYADQLEITEFRCSDGWFTSFKIRHHIAFKAISGEANSADAVAANNCKEIIPEICSEYEFKDIFNGDETGLFFRALLNKTLATRGE